MRRLTFALLALLTVFSAPLHAGSKPLVITSGQVQQIPTATTLNLNASTTGAASVNIPHGTAPTSPTNGDCWTTTSGFYCQISGLTVPLAMSMDRLVPSISTGFLDTGSTWPYQDFDVVRHSYGTVGAPIIPIVSNSAFYTPERIETYVGSGHKAGVQGRIDLLQMRGASGAGSTNYNYVAAQTYSSATTTDGGTAATRAGGQGQLFGGADLATLYSGATNWRNVTGREINVQISSGASVAYKSGLQIVAMSGDGVAGAIDDYALSFSNQTGAIGWKNLIGISGANGVSPLQTTGCVLCVADSPTFATGISFNGATVTGNAFSSNGFAINGSGDLIFRTATSPYSGAFVRLGAAGTASSTEGIQFLSSGATASTYDSAIIGFGGPGTQGAGGLNVDASVLQPAQNNYASLGTSGSGWAQLRLAPAAVSALPTCNAGAEGTLKAVNDANSTTFNAAIAGGGTNHVLAYCNGTGWTVH